MSKINLQDIIANAIAQADKSDDDSIAKIDQEIYTLQVRMNQEIAMLQTRINELSKIREQHVRNKEANRADVMNQILAMVSAINITSNAVAYNYSTSSYSNHSTSSLSNRSTSSLSNHSTSSHLSPHSLDSSPLRSSVSTHTTSSSSSSTPHSSSSPLFPDPYNDKVREWLATIVDNNRPEVIVHNKNLKAAFEYANPGYVKIDKLFSAAMKASGLTVVEKRDAEGAKVKIRLREGIHFS
jgi:hypothetical protein